MVCVYVCVKRKKSLGFLPSLANEGSIISFYQRNGKLLRALPSGWHQPVTPTELQTLALPTPTCCFVLSVPLLPASQGIATALGHGSSLEAHAQELAQQMVPLQDRMSQGAQMAKLEIGLSSKEKISCGYSVGDLNECGSAIDKR